MCGVEVTELIKSNRLWLEYLASMFALALLFLLTGLSHTATVVSCTYM